jgi:predicted MFS family arabinose efflux permease
VLPEINSLQKRLLLPALSFAVFSAAVIDVMLPLLLTDIAQTFQVPIGTASFISSISSLAGVSVGLLMAAATIRHNHKNLLLIGILCITIAALGSFLAPSLLFMDIVYSLNGIGSVMIGALALALIGEIYPLETRGKAVGWIIAAGFLAFTIGAPMTGILVTIGDWRTVMILFNLPVSIIALVFAFLAIPARINMNQSPAVSALTGCRQVISNRSAATCLIGIMFGFSTGAITTFVISFWREAFLLTTSLASIITMVNATSAAAGGIIAGRLVNRAGRKVLGIAAGFVESIMIILTFIVPTLALSWMVSVIRVFCYGMLSASFASLALEQLPEFKVTMMSLRGAFSGVGSFIGITIAGLFLNAFNYQVVGVVLASLGFISIGTVFLFTEDPTRCKTRGPR